MLDNIFDRQGMVVSAIPARDSSVSNLEERPPQLLFKIVRAYAKLQLHRKEVRELRDALSRWLEENEDK